MYISMNARPFILWLLYFYQLKIVVHIDQDEHWLFMSKPSTRLIIVSQARGKARNREYDNYGVPKQYVAS